MKNLGWLVVSAIGAVAAGGYLFLNVRPAALSDWVFRDARIAVSVAPVRRDSLPVVIRLRGELSAAQEANIISRLSGKVLEVRFKVGDSVPAGAVVATVHSGALAARKTELEAALEAARNDVKSSEERAARADKQLGQSREWHRQNLIARRDLDQVETAAQTARAQTELARANLAQQESMLAQIGALQSLARPAAPFSGVVTQRWAEPGASVNEFDPILTVANPDKVKITANYAGPHWEEVRSGMKVEISRSEEPEKNRVGKITRIDSVTEGEKQARQIVVEVENDRGSLGPGTTAQVLIELAKREDVLLVPRSAVFSLEGKSYLYKFVDGRAARQAVELGGGRGLDVAIERGISDGDTVIVDNQELLKPNTQVRAVTAPAPIRSKRE